MTPDPGTAKLAADDIIDRLGDSLTNQPVSYGDTGRISTGVQQVCASRA
jgi:hypothetical protein